jgi:glycosyltransferase involved in cell wall biosynthesis
MIDGARSAAAGRGVAVSLTPVALEADSRAFRIAQAIAEAGFRSIVIEARASVRRFWGDGVEVCSAGRADGAAKSGTVFRQGRLRDLVMMAREGRMGPVGEAALYAGYRMHEWRRYCHLPRPLIPQAELYVLHSFEMYRAVSPLARRSGARVLYDAHDFYRSIEPQERLLPFDRNLRQPFLRRLEDRLAAEADALTSVGNGIATLMTQAFGRRPEVIRNCHDDRFDRTNVPPLRRILGLGDRDLLAVAVGNYKAGMAVDAAAAALERLPENWHLAFLGRGYEALAHELPGGLVGKRLHICQAVAPDEIVPTIRSADIGLVLYRPFSENYRYALPNGFFQAIAAGLPLVRGELPEIEATIGGATIGYSLPHLQPENLASAMLRSAAMSDALRNNVAMLARTLRWESEAMRLRRLIDAVCIPSATSQLAPLGAAGASRLLKRV